MKTLVQRLSQRQVNEGTFLFLMPQFLRRGTDGLLCGTAGQIATSSPIQDTLSVSLGRRIKRCVSVRLDLTVEFCSP